jgi:hypothetical protein
MPWAVLKASQSQSMTRSQRRYRAGCRRAITEDAVADLEHDTPGAAEVEHEDRPVGALVEAVGEGGCGGSRCGTEAGDLARFLAAVRWASSAAAGTVMTAGDGVGRPASRLSFISVRAEIPARWPCRRCRWSS